MRISRCLYIVALMFGLSSLAKADAVDFHMTVLDPSPEAHATPVYGTKPFEVSFSACPKNIDATGCFLGENETNHITFYSLDITFANDTALGGQNATCDTSSSLSLFAFSSCTSPTLTDNDYFLNFFGGSGIAPEQFFYIAETGVKPKDFGIGTATVGVTPEPTSVVLLGTGIAMLGVFFVSRRRVAGRSFTV